MEIVLFGGLFLHIIYGMLVNIQNAKARPVRYKVDNNSQSSYFSKYMMHTAIVVGIFLILHIFDFYIKSKFLGGAEEVFYDGESYHDLAAMVIARFQMGGVVAFYVVALLGLGFHLHHGFQSAFQTLGVNHPVYSPVIKKIGIVYTVVVTLGFLSIPLFVYFSK